ncbi:hypothetical protein A6X21_12270 [Planctopirus hydrillae]|uniref:Uncharacterized protein n=1 Tax=Planctopirus hydrillae TaxID=1841610 RepID=A0A1C3E5G1_9PLAN|nr:hypothetical protein A6X21_12270 [Planctopirus hydrillae]
MMAPNPGNDHTTMFATVDQSSDGALLFLLERLPGQSSAGQQVKAIRWLRVLDCDLKCDLNRGFHCPENRVQ